MTPPAYLRRVLMTADTVGGVWTYAMELCRGLSRRGVEVMLATMGAPLREDQRAEVSRIKRVTVAESRFALEWMDHPWQDVREAGSWLLALEEAFQPDIIHLNGYAHGALRWQAPVVVVGHSCVLSWWKAVKGVAAPDSWDAYRRVIGEGIHQADQVVAPTCWMLHELERCYGPLGDPRVISNARSLPPIRMAQAKEPFVLSVGRLWDEAKNASTLAAAAKGLPWPVWVAGDAKGPTGTIVEFPNVHLLGYRAANEVRELYRRASIYALPARYEPFGLSALEAAQAGCALVLGDIPSLREVWGDAAIYVPPSDPHALRAAIARLIDRPSELERYRMAARLRSRRYSVDGMIDAYLNAYAALLRPVSRIGEVVADPT